MTVDTRTAAEMLCVSEQASFRGYDVTADGERFLFQRVKPDPASEELVVIQNWSTRLKQLMAR